MNNQRNRNLVWSRIEDELDMDIDNSYLSDSDADDMDYFPIENEFSVDSFSSAEEIDNLEQNISEEIAIRPEIAFLSKDKLVQYSSQPIDVNVRVSFRQNVNIISGPKTNATSNIEDCASAFLLYLRPIEQIILRMTNLYGLRKYKEVWANIDRKNLHAYIGLLLRAGLYRSYGECVTQLWSESNGRPIFRATMSLCKFKMIHQCIRFDDKSDRPIRSLRDKLASIRNVYDRWNRHLKTLYTVGKSITVDEQLVPYRGRFSFRQYIPTKPGKYGIKVFILCDAESRYTYNTIVYTGLDRNCSREQNQGQRIVSDLCEGLTDRTITCDNFFTSYKLAEELLKTKLWLVGTIRKNKREIPPIILDMKRKSVYSTVVAYQHNLPAILLSYVPKKKSFCFAS